MGANFGNSKLQGMVVFYYVLTLQMLKSAHPDWYAGVRSPFVLPTLTGGAKAMSHYEGYLDISVVPSDGKSVRDILGENPSVVVRNLRGVVSVEILGWSDNGQLHVDFVPEGSESCVCQIEKIIDSDGVIRWSNPELED